MKLCRVKIDQPGYQNFSQELSGVQFTDGVSDHPIPEYLMASLGAIFKLVTVEEDGSSQQVGAGVFTNMQRAGAVATVTPEKVTDADGGQPPQLEPGSIAEAEAYARTWTETELSNIADESGIRGLRDIAEPRNVRNTSIRGLIAEILAGQEARAKLG